MTTALKNNFTFDSTLLARALQFAPGTFVALDDLAFSENTLGKRIAQTMQIDVDGRTVSVAYNDGDAPAYDLILQEDRPEVLGTYPELIERYPDLHARVMGTFGGPGRATIHEIVTTMVLAMDEPSAQLAVVALKGRQSVKRGSWVANNRYDAMALAPVDWANLGL
jgi:hypothetical protein